MNEINEDYMSMFSENGVTLGSSHYKKHLKLVIKENVPGVELVKPHRLNEFEQVMSSRALAEAVDKVAHQESEETLKHVADVAKLIRGELLNHRDTWHFTGSMWCYKIGEESRMCCCGAHVSNRRKLSTTVLQEG